MFLNLLWCTVQVCTTSHLAQEAHGAEGNRSAKQTQPLPLEEPSLIGEQALQNDCIVIIKG